MNATPAPDSPPSPYERAVCGTPVPYLPKGESIPRQKEAAQASGRPPGVAADALDPLDHPAIRIAAQAAAVENLLRCWVRENDLPAPDDGTLRIPLPASGSTLLVPVRHWSPSGWHRFGLPSSPKLPTGHRPSTR